MIWSVPLVYYLMSGTSSVVNDTCAYGFQLPATAIGLQQIGRETYFPFKRQTLKRIKRNDNLDTSLEKKIDKAVSKEVKDFAKSYQKVVRPVLRAKIKAELAKEKAVEAKEKAELAKEKAELAKDNEVKDLRKDLKICQDKVDDNEKYMWKVSARVYLDDVEALYKPHYDAWKNKRIAEEKAHKDAHNKRSGPKEEYVPLYTTPSDRVDGRDPKAVRIRQKSDFWDWLTTTKTDEKKIKNVLEQMEQQYRFLKKIPERVSLTEDQKSGLEEFRKNMCRAIGEASETASFIIHGSDAFQLFKGRLQELHVFGDGIDEYMVPVLNALAPIVDKNTKCAVFQKST